MRAACPLPLFLAFLCAAASLAPARAQEPDTTIVVTGVREEDSDLELPDLEQGTTPGGAFLRALLLPGWGHASIGAYTRGGFYFGAETATGFMLVRTALRRAAAEDVRDLREADLRAELARRGITAPDTVAVLLDGDPAVDDARELVEARSQQFEDWLALGIFLTFLSGADAFVSAHLADFPEPLELEATVVPTPRGLAAGIGVRVPLRLPGG